MRNLVLRTVKAELLVRLGEPGKAARSAKALLRVTDSVQLAARLYEVRIWAAVTTNDVRAANALADEAIAQCAGSAQATRLTGLAALCRLLVADFDGARRLCASLPSGQDSGDAVAEACRLYVDAVHLYVERDLQSALSTLDDAEALLEIEGGNPALSVLGGLLRASIHDMRGDAVAAAVAESLRADADQLGGLWRAWHAVVAGLIAYNCGRWDDVLDEVGAVEPDPAGLGRPLAALGAGVALRRGNVRGAEELLAAAPGPSLGIAAFYEHIVLLAQAQVEIARGRPERAAAIARAVAEGEAGTAHRGNAVHGVATGLVRIAVASGDLELARALASEAASRPDHSAGAQATALHCRGLADGDPALLRTAARTHLAAGHQLAAARAEEDAALLLAAAGDLPAARAAFGTALGGYAELAAIGDAGRAAAAGRARGVRTGARGPRKRPASGWEALTTTEQRVADLVEEGLTNAGIAARLAVSPRTVQSHVAAILRKLGVGSRAQIAAAAAVRKNQRGAG